MIQIKGTRFGTVEIDGQALIRFPNGLIGFPKEDTFVLLEREGSRLVGYLQSVRTPALAFPVTDGTVFGPAYPNPPALNLAQQVGVPTTDLAVFVIVAVNPEDKTLDANMLAPLIIDVASRTGAQVVLDPRKFSAQQSLAAIQQAEEKNPAAAAEPAQGSSEKPPLRLVGAVERAAKLAKAASI